GKINTTRTVAWTTSGTVPNVKLEYSKDNFVADVRVITASAANTGSYNWVVPDDPTTTARVRVSDVNDGTVLDTSDAVFRIEGFFTLTAPNGGESWPVGSTQTISWVSGGTIPNVKLEYSRDNFATATLITASTPSVNNVGGSFAWTVPDAISSTVKIRVSDVNNSAVADVSDGNFAIQAGFTVTAPNGGEREITYEDRTVTWSESVLTSPILRAVPANPKNMFGNRVPYKAVWTKSGYFDGSKDYMADGVCRDEAGNPNPAYCPDSDLRFFVPMESTLVHTN